LTSDSASRPKTSGVSAREESTDSAVERTLAEWVTLLISLAILLTAFAAVTYLYVAGDGDPILISAKVDLDNIRESDGTFYVPVIAYNDGDSSASEVQIEAELTIGEEVETSSFAILTLSGNDSETAIIAFSRDPREGEFTVRVTSYIE
jgi:uncharacterized protein (TIGR02588 family)